MPPTSLVGSLIVMVMFSGYENFVSRIDTANEKDTLGVLDRMSFAQHREPSANHS